VNAEPLLCPACARPVQEGWEHCAACGEPLTLPSRVVVDRAGRPVPRWLERSRRRAGELKAEGEAGSGLRMEALRQVDSVRETEQIRAAKARALEGKQVLAISGIAAGIFLVLIVVLAVASLH
jgi:tetrahydromethanopterin S-methyltransferase subunit F